VGAASSSCSVRQLAPATSSATALRIFGGEGYLRSDLLAATLQSNREVDVFVPRMARQKIFAPTHPTSCATSSTSTCERRIGSRRRAHGICFHAAKKNTSTKIHDQGRRRLRSCRTSSPRACAEGQIHLQDVHDDREYALLFFSFFNLFPIQSRVYPFFSSDFFFTRYVRMVIHAVTCCISPLPSPTSWTRCPSSVQLWLAPPTCFSLRGPQLRSDLGYTDKLSASF
jgi:hypothetical protein